MLFSYAGSSFLCCKVTGILTKHSSVECRYNRLKYSPKYNRHPKARPSLQWRQTGEMVSQITSLAIVYSIYQAQIKENIKAPRHWPLCGEFTGGRRIPPHKWPVTRKMFPFDDVIMREDDTSPITCCLVSRAQRPSKPVSMLSGWGHTWCVFSEFKSEYDLFAKFCTHDCVTYHRVRTSPVYQVAGWLLCAWSHSLQASLGTYSMNIHISTLLVNNPRGVDPFVLKQKYPWTIMSILRLLIPRHLASPGH